MLSKTTTSAARGAWTTTMTAAAGHACLRAFSSDAVAKPSLVKRAARQGISGVVATVFGSSGFLGRYVVNDFGRIGSQVVLPYRGDGFNMRHLKVVGDLGQVIPLSTDVRDDDSIRRAVARSNVVINLIGQDHPTRNWSFEAANVDLAARIARISREEGAARFIHVSALGADEQSSSAWLASKARGEAAVRSEFPSATIVRPSRMFGIEDRFLNTMATLFTVMPVFPLVNSGEQLIQPSNVADVGRAIFRAVELPEAEGQIYELAGPETMSWEQMADFIFKELKAETNTTLALPLPIARIYGRIMQLIPEKYRVLTEDQVLRMQYDNVLSNAHGVKQFEDLGITPSSFKLHASALLKRHTQDTRLFIAGF